MRRPSLIKTIRSLAADGYCVVFISHKLDEVCAVADRVTVLARGKVVATSSPPRRTGTRSPG